jgi:hypothetical protein
MFVNSLLRESEKVDFKARLRFEQSTGNSIRREAEKEAGIEYLRGNHDFGG